MFISSDRAKPCPFCGSQDLVFEVDDTREMEHGWVLCIDCFAHGPDVSTGGRDNEDPGWYDKAIEKWNKRI